MLMDGVTGLDNLAEFNQLATGSLLIQDKDPFYKIGPDAWHN